MEFPVPGGQGRCSPSRRFRGGGCAALVVVRRVEVAQRRVEAVAVVEDLDPLEDRVGEPGAGGPRSRRSRSRSAAEAKSNSVTPLSSASPTVPIDPSRAAPLSRRPNTQDVCWGVPWLL